MIIDGNCGECNIRFLPCPFPPCRPLERSCIIWALLWVVIDCREFLSYGRSVLPSLCVFTPFQPFFSSNWLTDWLRDWQDQCSRTVFTRDRPRSHMTPVYIPACLRSGLQPKKNKKEAGVWQKYLEDILSQSNVCDLLTCRHLTVGKHRIQASTWSTKAQARPKCCWQCLKKNHFWDIYSIPKKLVSKLSGRCLFKPYSLVSLSLSLP